MVTRTNMVLVITGVLFALIGLFAPAANLLPAATPVSLFQIVNSLTGWAEPGGLSLPAELTLNQTLYLGLVGGMALMAAISIVLALFKALRWSLIPSAIMAGAAGYLMFSLTGMKGLAIAVPGSYGWILMIAGSMVATVTGLFALFGPGPDERKVESDTAPKDLGYMAEWRPATEAKPAEVSTPIKPETPISKPPAPKSRASKNPKPPPPKSKTPKPKSPKPKSPKPKSLAPDTPEPATIAPLLAAAKPASAKAPDKSPDNSGSSVPPADPDTIDGMAANGIGNEEPTESGGWVLSGFDADGMAVRLNISDLDLRISNDGILIGRNAKQCRLILNDDSVSRRHARLSGTNPMMIEDLDSANGTVVDRVRLAPGEKVPIEPGVAIEIGAVRLTLVRS